MHIPPVSVNDDDGVQLELWFVSSVVALADTFRFHRKEAKQDLMKVTKAKARVKGISVDGVSDCL